ncbi:MAG: glycosyltransferase family 39 protein [Candidatus Omnitrophota bacterium]
MKKIKAGPWMVFTAIGAFMLAISWLKWPDVLIDFGRELYLPWVIKNGAVLYRDVAYFNGPFSPYFNAILFRFFGTSLMTLVFFNILLIALLTFLIYKIFCFMTNRVAAAAAGAVFLSVFAFSQYTMAGNYNFVCPYSHDVTHGVILSFVALYAFSVYLRHKKMRWAILTGFLTGSIFLTKIEVFLAIVVAIFSGIILSFFSEKSAVKEMFKCLAGMCAAGLLPIAAFTLYLTFFMPFPEAVSSLIASYKAVLNTDVASGLFYKRMTGAQAPLFSMVEMIKNSIFYIAAIPVIILATRTFSYIYRKEGRLKALTAAIIPWLLLLFLSIRYIKYPINAKGLPVLLAMFLFYALYVFISARSRGKKIIASKYLLLSVFTIYGFVLLFKIFLNVRIYHYGFALAMPGALILTAVFVYFIPKFLARAFGNIKVIRNIVLSAAVIVLVTHITIAKEVYGFITYPVGSGPDTILTFRPEILDRGAVMNAALDEIKKNIPRESNFVVFPEGVMLNYMSRVKNPSPYIVFMPPDLSIFSEETILKSFETNPPDYVIVADKNMSEYGYSAFGRDYGMRIYSWIEENYVPFSVAGDPSPGKKGFSIILNKRKK